MRRPPHRIRAARILVGVLLGLALDARHAASADEQDAIPLTELTLEELMDVKVTLPSRRPESRSLAASPVFVVTQDDIRRSGVTNIPDALRLAPGVQVAEGTASQWAVGIRGFASRLTRSLLVLMDGRSVYTPLFAGTYWEVQNTFLEDIDRIEVVRGPGGALWGPNAFNGVINTVTKSARETQGLLAVGGGGTEERAFGRVRYGGKVGDDLHYRLYGLYFDRAAFPTTGDVPSVDDWRNGQGGFRIDWDATTDDAFTLQGDIYDGKIGQNTPIIAYEPPFVSFTDEDVDVSGGNVLGRWNRRLGAGADLVLQMYYDHTFRRDPTFSEQRDTFEVDFQNRLELPWRQELLWGFLYRVSADATHGVPTIQFVPPSETLHLVSGFLQDDVWLVPDSLRLSLGVRFDSTTYTDFDYQPSGSLLWLPAPRHTTWASISRAVRTPSRIERALRLTGQPINLDRPGNVQCLPPGSRCVYPQITGSDDFENETILAYQLGYRMQPIDEVFFDVAAFFNEYDHLQTGEQRPPFDQDEPPLPHTLIPIVFTNLAHGQSYGVEVTVTALPRPWWRLSGVYSYLEIDLRTDPGVADVTGAEGAANGSPHHQVTAQSSLDLPWDVSFDAVFRFVDKIRIGAQLIPSYATFDVRLAQQLTEHLEISVVGQNLAQAEHREFFPGNEVPRGMYGQVRWRW
jgi:iron complex outermembrane receptor protein